MDMYDEDVLTEGHPVSAMYMIGSLLRAVAASTSVSWKNVAVQSAASSIETFPNHGWTLAIYHCKREKNVRLNPQLCVQRKGLTP